ncbi:MAG: helix-turn-helix domain-containing protein [Clostridia bacterium]|nr:helix-turn-helix domain-containing protein [Clostridia bacterium]
MYDELKTRPDFGPGPFGKWLARRRITLGLTQQELAEKVHVTHQYISWLEGPDASMPRPIVMKKILDALDAAEQIRVECPVGSVMVLTSDILTVAEAAERANVSKAMIYEAVAEGDMRSYALSRRNIRLKALELEEWLTRHEQGLRAKRLETAMQAFGRTG